MELQPPIFKGKLERTGKESRAFPWRAGRGDGGDGGVLDGEMDRILGSLEFLLRATARRRRMTNRPFGCSAHYDRENIYTRKSRRVNEASNGHPRPVSGNEYEVGDEEGWTVPSDDQFYNKWASKNRFLEGDTIVFKYKKDSVMVVTEEEYGNCSSSHPVLFDNKGRTEVELDHAGSFFFVSGISGHCKMGQKMIVKVLGGEGSAPPAANRTAAGPPAAAEGSAAAPGGAVSSFLFLLALFVGLFSCSSSRF